MDCPRVEVFESLNVDLASSSPTWSPFFLKTKLLSMKRHSETLKDVNAVQHTK